MNEVQAAQAALVFLDRVPLEGREAEALVSVRQWCRSFLRPQAIEDAPETDQKPAENA